MPHINRETSQFCGISIIVINCVSDLFGWFCDSIFVEGLLILTIESGF